MSNSCKVGRGDKDRKVRFCCNCWLLCLKQFQVGLFMVPTIFIKCYFSLKHTFLSDTPNLYSTWLFELFYACMTMHNVGWGTIFFCLHFFQSERYCIFCPVSRKVSVFISTDRGFYVVFKYVVYIRVLTGKLSKFPLSAGHKNGGPFSFLQLGSSSL